MAEEVEIVGVDGGPAAEATLRKLLVEMQKKNGTDVNSAKVQEQYNKAKKEGTKVLDEFGNEVEEATSAVAKFGRATGGLISTIYNGLIGTINFTIDVFGNLVTAFADGEGKLADFAALIPFAGGILSSVISIFENTLTTFQSLATTGAGFNNTLTTLRISAAQARVSLDSFAELVATNTDRLVAYGGTVTKGALMIGKLNNALGNDFRDQLMGMGLTFEEINETLVDYMYLNRAGARANKRQTAELAESAAGYAKNLMLLAKLSGEDIKSQRDKLANASMDIAFQRKMATLNIREQDKMHLLLADTLASGGQIAVDALKTEFLGMPPLTQALQIFFATQSENAMLIRDNLKTALNTSVGLDKWNSTQTTRLADYVEARAKAGDNFDTILRAAASGMDGVSAQILENMSQGGMSYEKYLDESGRFLRDKFENDYNAAVEEQKKRDKVVTGLNDFYQVIRGIKETIEEKIILPLSKIIGPSLVRFGELLGSEKVVGGIKEFSKVITDFVNMISDDINTLGLKDAITHWLGEIKNILIDGMKGMLFGTVGQQRENTINYGPDDGSRPMPPELVAASSGILGDFLPNIDNAKDWAKFLGTSSVGFIASLGALGVVLAGFGLAGGPIAIGVGLLTAFLTGSAWSFDKAATGFSKVADSIVKISTGLTNISNLDSKKINEASESLGPLSLGLTKLAGSGILNLLSGESNLENLATSLSNLGNVDSKNLSLLTDQMKDLQQLEFNLDASPIDTFREAIDELRQSLDNLNDELAQDNNGFFGNKRADAGQLLEGLTAGSSSGSNDEVKRLNTTMMRVVGLLEKNQTQNTQIIDGLKKVRGEI